MSYFDDASLVMIPSGYKDQKVYSVKPIDGSGDLTFSRASNASRTNSSGLVEKVRTNLLTYSNDFSNAAWAKINNVSVSATRVADPFGGTTAWQIIYDGTTDGRLEQVASGFSGTGTQSAWLRVASGTQEVKMGAASGSLTTLVVTTTWTRFSATTTSGNFPRILCNASTTIEVYGCQFEASDFGPTPYIATTTTAVSVGPVSGLPRLDYSGGASCPSLLLEGQRTNVVTFSEQFDNAAWTKSGNGVGVTPAVTANDGISPDGYQNADKIDLSLGGGTSSSDWSWVYQTFSVTANQPQAISIYLKAATAGDVGKKIRIGLISYVEHTLTADWTRVQLNQTIGSTASYSIGFRLRGSEGTASTASLYAWGAQLEQNASYATSYIPTLSSAVTRVQDSCNKTSASALIGATAGTMFIEVENNPSAYLFSAPNNVIFASINSGDYLNNFHFTTDNASVYLYCNASGGSLQAAIGTTLPTTSTLKMAVTYTGSAIKFFLNGALVGTDTSFTLPSGMSRIDVGHMGGQPDSQRMRGNTKQFLLFTSALSDADAITLTA